MKRPAFRLTGLGDDGRAAPVDKLASAQSHGSASHDWPKSGSIASSNTKVWTNVGKRTRKRVSDGTYGHRRHIGQALFRSRAAHAAAAPNLPVL